MQHLSDYKANKHRNILSVLLVDLHVVLARSLPSGRSRFDGSEVVKQCFRFDLLKNLERRREVPNLARMGFQGYIKDYMSVKRCMLHGFLNFANA